MKNIRTIIAWSLYISMNSSNLLYPSAEPILTDDQKKEQAHIVQQRAQREQAEEQTNEALLHARREQARREQAQIRENKLYLGIIGGADNYDY